MLSKMSPVVLARISVCLKKNAAVSMIEIGDSR